MKKFVLSLVVIAALSSCNGSNQNQRGAQNEQQISDSLNSYRHKADSCIALARTYNVKANELSEKMFKDSEDSLSSSVDINSLIKSNTSLAATYREEGKLMQLEKQCYRLSSEYNSKADSLGNILKGK